MAILSYLGFSHFPTGASGMNFATPAYPKWNLSDAWTKGTGMNGYSAAQTVGGNNLIFADGATYVSMIVGGRFLTNAVAVTNTVELFSFRDGTAQHCGVGISGSKLIFFRGTTATVLATGTTTLVANSWYYVECKVTINNTTGSFEVKLGGASEIALTTGQDTQNTANAFISRVYFLGLNSNPGPERWQDIYVSDTSGGAPGNDFLGMCIVDTLFPTTDNSVQFTPLSSTNASNVDDPALDSDTTYNSSTTSGHVDTFNHGALPVTPANIFSASVLSMARKDDVAARSVRNKLISGGTTSNGVSTPLGTAYLYVRDDYPTDPNTAAAWTKSGIDATKIGYEHV